MSSFSTAPLRLQLGRSTTRAAASEKNMYVPHTSPHIVPSQCTSRIRTICKKNYTEMERKKAEGRKREGRKREGRKYEGRK